MKSILAIDPGASGGFALASRDITECFPTPPTTGDICDLVRSLKAEHDLYVCYIEDIPKFTGKLIPSSSAAVLFENYGFTQGVLMAMGVPTIRVRPQEWQKHFSLGTARACGSTTVWKNKLKAEAQRRFPNCKVTLKTADALLILDYARAMEGVK